MLRVLRMAIVFYVAVLLQGVLAPAIAVWEIRPDFVFLVVLLIAFKEGAAGGALAGFVAGLFVDLNSAGALGVTSLTSALVAFAVGSVADRLMGANAATRIIVALLATLLRDQLVYLVLLPDGLLGALKMFYRAALPGAFYTALLAAPVMSLAEMIIRWPAEVRRAVR